MDYVSEEELAQDVEVSRRRFGLELTSSLAAPALILPNAGEANEVKREIIRSQIAFSLLRRRIAVTYLLIDTVTGIFGVDLRGTHVQQDENRGSLGGLLGGIQRPTIARMVTDATLFGQIFLAGSTLYLMSRSPEVDKVLIGASVVIAHGNHSWKPGSFRPVNVTGYPIDAQIEQMRQIGEMYLFQRNLALAMIYPVLGNNSAAGF